MNFAFSEVLHTTLNPDGPGAIRIHLIPPKPEADTLSPSVAIINGTDILPVNFIWAVMLAELIRETNRFLRKWWKALDAGDPYYNVNLTRTEEDFSLR